MKKKQTQETTDSKEEMHSENVLKKISGNWWIVSTIILGILLVVLLGMGGLGSQKVLSGNVVGQKVVDFANSQGANAQLVSVDTDGDLYEVVLSIDGQDFPVYATKDGKNLITGMIPLETQVQTPTTNTQTQQASSGFSENDLVKLKEFNDCLGEKGIKIYGANWCGWTKRLVIETLGGYDACSAIYIECTENEALCSDEGIQGFPTIKLNGKTYNGQRTLEDLGRATGCPVPQLQGSVGVASSDVQCG